MMPRAGHWHAPSSRSAQWVPRPKGRGRVVGSIIMHGVGLALLGVVAGLAAALPAARLIESLLFDVSPRDPAPLGIVAAFMIVVAALASAIPAMRAARVDPLRVLRADWKSV
jgi:ABC-type lipoprotein release transport system permease subunit